MNATNALASSTTAAPGHDPAASVATATRTHFRRTHDERVRAPAR